MGGPRIFRKGRNFVSDGQVRLSVTFVCCIQTAKDIVKLLSRPGSPIILVIQPQAPIPNCKGNHFSGASNRPGGENL